MTCSSCTLQTTVSELTHCLHVGCWSELIPLELHLNYLGYQPRRSSRGADLRGSSPLARPAVPPEDQACPAVRSARSPSCRACRTGCGRCTPSPTTCGGA